MNDQITTCLCQDGQKYLGQFKERYSVLRYVVQGKAGEELQGHAIWDSDIPSVIRCIIQSPDGTVLCDKVNVPQANVLNYSLVCQTNGPYSVYFTPIAISKRSCTLNFFAGEPAYAYQWRRWPCLFVVDRSKTMSEEEMGIVERTLTAALEWFRGDPQALEIVCLSCISFDARAVVHSLLTDVVSYELPLLNRNPFEDGDIAAATRAVEHFCSSNVRFATSTQKGDWRPIVFLFTNGNCLNGWNDVALTRCAVFLVGENASVANANRLSDTVVKCNQNDLAHEVIPSFFKIKS